jgi:PKD repeat protein
MLIAFVIGGDAFAQNVDVINNGALIRIREGATFYIGGSYTDGNTPMQPKDGPEPLDAPIFLSGKLQINGDIINLRSSTKLIFDFEDATQKGTVVLGGNSDQSILGTDVYFPNLIVDKTGGKVIINQTVKVNNTINTKNGSINLNNHNIQMGVDGQIFEKEPATIFGDTGEILSKDGFTINANIDSINYRGYGLGFKTASGQNPSAVTILRIHDDNGIYPLAADGQVALRSYQLKFAPGPTSFTTVYFNYHDSEITSPLTESNIAVYHSRDGGLTWLNITSGVDMAGNVVTCNNVAITGTNDFSNIFVLTKDQCSPANTPKVVLTNRKDGILRDQHYINICEGEDLSLTIPPGSPFYLWTGPDGLSGYTSSDSTYHIDDVARTTSIDGFHRVLTRTPRGCEGRNKFTVNVRSIPVPKIKLTPDPAAPAPICLRTIMDFQDISTTADTTAITGWAWNVDDGPDNSDPGDDLLQSSNFFQYAYPTGGVKKPTLVVTSVHGCVSPMTSRDVIIDTLPIPVFYTSNNIVGDVIEFICEDKDVKFNNPSTYTPYPGSTESSTMNYVWTFDDAGITSTVKEPVHQYETYVNSPDTIRTVKLVVYATATGCHDEITHEITVRPEPIPMFTPTVDAAVISEACTGIYFDFKNSTTMPGPYGAVSYVWDFDNGTDGTEVEPRRQFGQEKTVYNVKVTAKSDHYGCSESIVKQVTIYPAPEGHFLVTDPDICLDEIAEFTNQSTIVSGTLSYNWDFDDTSTSASAAPTITHTYTQPRQYKVTLTRTSDFGCTNQVSRTVRVHPSPIADFQFENACDKKDVKFFNSSVIQLDNISDYLWTFGDGMTSTQISPTHIFTTFGVYNTTLKATSSFGCTDQITFSPEVYRNPEFNLGTAIAACSDNYMINPSSAPVYLPPGVTYEWTDSNGAVMATTPTLSVNTSGVYSVVVETHPQSCQTKTNLPLFLFKPADLGSDVSACAQVILDAEANLPGEKTRAETTTYQWKKNGVNYSINQVLTVTEPGDYEVTIARGVASTFCSSSDVVHVDIALPLSLTLPPHITQCSGFVTLDAGVTADSYEWTNVNSGQVVGALRTLTIDQSDVYRVVVVSGACSASSATDVVFSGAPNVSFSMSSSQVCSDQNITFTDISFSDDDSIVSTEWDLGEGTILNDQPAASTTYTTGSYTVKLTALTAGGCSATYSKVIDVKTTPALNVTIPDVCENTPISITNNTTAWAFDWDFSDGTSDTGATPVKSFDEAGLKNILVTATEGGCSAMLTIPVTVNAQPKLEFGSEVTTCGSSIVLDAGNAGANYRWYDPANAAVSLATTQTYPVSSDGQIGVEITNVNGCMLTQETSVKLNTIIAPTLGSDRSVCDEINLYPGYFPGATYSWTTGDSTPSIDINVSGNYGVTITDQNGCTGSASVDLQVNETPVITNWTNINSVCDGQSISLSPASSVTADYLWSTGSTAPSIEVTSGGTYSVTISNGICSVVKTTDVNLSQTPVAVFSANSVCAGESLSFQNTSTYGGPDAVSYLWDFGDNTFSSNASPSKRYNGPSTASVTLKAQSENGCSSQVAHNVNVKHMPVAVFSIAATCSGNPADFTNSSTYTGSSPITYNWNSGSGDTYEGLNPPFVYPLSGSYVVTLQSVTAEGCSDTYLQQVDIGETPDVTGWLTEINSCNTSVTLDASNAGSTYLWNDNSTQQTLAVTSSGTYEVTIASGDNCQATASVDVTISAPPQSTLPSSMNGCGSVLIDPQSVAATYNWSTGETTPTILVFNSDIYSVTLISTQLCINTYNTDVDVFTVPTFELGTDRFACDGETVTLTSNVAIPVTYEWSTTEATPSIDVTATDLYTLKVTSADGCPYEDNVNVIFKPVPVIDISNDVTACGEVTLDAKNPGATYEWSTGSANQKIITKNTGIYDLTVRNSVACSASKQINVTILQLPVFDLGENKVVCDGQTVTVDGGSVVDTFQSFTWSDNSGGRFLTVGSTGQYSATAIGINGCESTDVINVTVRPSLGLELGNDRMLCSGSGFSLSAGINDVSYNWGSDNGSASQAKDIIIGSAGRYWVTIKDAFGCTMSDSVRVTPTTEALDASFLVSSVVGQGDLVHFSKLNQGDDLTYAWDFGDGGSSSAETPEHRYFSDGDFEVTLTVSNGTCSDALTKIVTVRIARFETKPDPVLPHYVEIIEASLSPNPSTGNVTIRVSLTAETEVIMEIYSLQGVQQLQYSKNLKEDDISFDLSTLAQGPYVIRVIAGNKTRLLKLIKAN